MTGINLFVSGYLASDVRKMSNNKGQTYYLGTIKYSLGDEIVEIDGSKKKKWIYLSFTSYADLSQFEKLNKSDFIVMRGTLDCYLRDDNKNWIMRVEKLIFSDGQAKPENYNLNSNSGVLNVEPVKLNLDDNVAERDFSEFDKFWEED